jgi:hypothetical protein
MASVLLAQIDTAFSRPAVAHVVPKLPLQPGGVDPLGLRQLNLDLMDWALPGINNVTVLIRPYVLMTWAWWKAAEIVGATGTTSVALDVLQELVDRIETAFIWSHLLVGQHAGLPGRLVLGRALPKSGQTKAYSFAGSAWNKLRKERRANTSLMSAVQYGPSIRTLEGIGWLVPEDSGAMVPVEDVMSAVDAFDRKVAPHVPAMLTKIGSGSLTSNEAAKLHAVWPTSKPTPEEKRVFRQVFYERGKSAPADSREARRHNTLNLIFAMIASSKTPLKPEAIRQMMCGGVGPNGNSLKIPRQLQEAYHCWIALQARQLQRLGLEALLVWVENEITEMGGAAEAAALSSHAHRLASKQAVGGNARTVRSFREANTALGKRYGWPAAAAMKGKANIFDLMTAIVSAQQEAEFDTLPGLALKAIAFAADMTEALMKLGEYGGLDGLLGGDFDRLPLELLVKRLAALGDAPLNELWNEIVESWVLGQHVTWSVARSGDETQRLRVAIDEGGWVRLWPKLSGPFRPTPDRLQTALALSADCGLLSRGPGAEPSYSQA